MQIVGFSVERAVRNTRILIEGVLKVFCTIFSKYPLASDDLPKQGEYRMSLMCANLTWWELYALFIPEEIKNDPFDLLTRIRGGGYF